jgi:uncharacterized membrane protein YhaH (DUF805 family)
MMKVVEELGPLKGKWLRRGYYLAGAALIAALARHGWLPEALFVLDILIGAALYRQADRSDRWNEVFIALIPMLAYGALLLLLVCAVHLAMR